MSRLKSLIGNVVFLAHWEVLARVGPLDPDHFPPLREIAASLVEDVSTPSFLGDLAATLTRTLTGLGIAIVLGLALALLSGRFQLVRRMLAPFVDMLRVIPPPAIVPLSMFALGLGTPLFIFIIAFASIWPIYINAANALAAPEPVQMATGRSLGYSDGEILLRIRLPSAMPEIFTGIRIGTGTSLLAAVAAEMLAGNNGLGHLLFDAGFGMRSAEMFGLMFLIGAAGVLLNFALGLVRSGMIAWHIRLAGMMEH